MVRGSLVPNEFLLGIKGGVRGRGATSLAGEGTNARNSDGPERSDQLQRSCPFIGQSC